MNRISILIVFFAKNWKFIFWSFVSSFLLAFVISVLGINKLGGFLTSSREFKYKIPTEEELGSSSLGQASVSKGAYQKILKRNLFKAVTEGEELNSESSALNSSQEKGKVKSIKDLTKSRLPFILVGLIFGGDPYSGVAMIKLKSKKRKGVSSFFTGDFIDKEVKLIEVHQDKIVIENKSRFEYIPLVEKKKKKKKSARRSRSSRFRKKRTLPENYSEEGFERKGGEIVMSTEYRKKMLTVDFTKVLQDAKAEPNFVGRELNGFRLTRIKPESIYEKSGFMNGDIITEINGVSLVDTGQAIRLLQSLRGAEEIEVILLRNGQEMTSNIQVK